MGTKERLNILKLKLDDEMKIKCRVFKDEDIKKEGNIWYIPGQDGSVKAVKVEPMKTKKDVITELLKRISNIEFEVEERDRRIDKAIEFVESMEYMGYEDYFYDLKANDINGNDNCFEDSQRKLLSILKGEDKE
jgi:hypothetical protein